MSRYITFVLFIAAATPVAGQDCPLLHGGQKIESGRYILSYRTQPAKLAVSQHFLVELVVLYLQTRVVFRLQTRQPVWSEGVIL